MKIRKETDIRQPAKADEPIVTDTNPDIGKPVKVRVPERIRTSDEEQLRYIEQKFEKNGHNPGGLSLYDQVTFVALLSTERDFTVSEIEALTGIPQQKVSGLLSMHDNLSPDVIERVRTGYIGYSKGYALARARLSPRLQLEVVLAPYVDPENDNSAEILEAGRPKLVPPKGKSVQRTHRRLIRKYRANPGSYAGAVLAGIDFALGLIGPEELEAYSEGVGALPPYAPVPKVVHPTLPEKLDVQVEEAFDNDE